MTAACREATDWLVDDVVVPIGTFPARRRVVPVARHGSFTQRKRLLAEAFTATLGRRHTQQAHNNLLLTPGCRQHAHR